jgi:dynein assembly factor 3, axonemal
MDIAEAIGFIQFWGLTPSMNLLESVEGDYNILLTGTGDIRHLIRSISEEVTSNKTINITFYLQEYHKEVLGRHLLLLLLINDLSLPIRERVEMFLEIYGNTLIRERTSEYIQRQGEVLIKIITEHKNAPDIKSLFDLSGLKYKDRDELEEVFLSWSGAVEFDMGGLRDQRLRYHYKDRYDYRDNLADWDYHWSLKALASTVSYRHYKEWRRTGVAYEYRLATYTSPNKTLSSYIPGKKVNFT